MGKKKHLPKAKAVKWVLKYLRTTNSKDKSEIENKLFKSRRSRSVSKRKGRLDSRSSSRSVSSRNTSRSSSSSSSSSEDVPKVLIDKQ
ncbi:494_t:CDS:2, partial [Racocetra fulgida]